MGQTESGVLSAEARAFLSYVRNSGGVSALPVVFLRAAVDDELDAMTDASFGRIERALDDALAAGDLEYATDADRGGATFSYDTRLLLPALLTHARLHAMAGNVPFRRRLPGRRVDRDLLSRAGETTYRIVQALLDGDMQDAINDAEYADFQTNCRPRSEVAKIAQGTLAEAVGEWFAAPETPDAVAERYRHAVDLSNAHQAEDGEFRELLERCLDATGEERERAIEEIERRYRDAAPREPAPLFEAERDLPYFTTQYERVGVIYEDMLGMYEAALDLDLGRDFARSIVLMVVAAQIGLDDTDDYPEDRGAQLTPVTAELNRASDVETGVDSLRDIVTAYLDRAAAYAPDHLTGLAVEYIRQQSAIRLDRLARTAADRSA